MTIIDINREEGGCRQGNRFPQKAHTQEERKEGESSGTEK